MVGTKLLIRKAAVTSQMLHTSGGLIKDASNNTVMLRGAVTYLCKENNQTKFTKIADMGANVVRIAFWKDAIEGNWAAPCTAGVTALDTAIGYAATAGLKVILDQHFWEAGVENAALAFFTDSGLQQEWLDMWSMLITRYAENETVIGLDLMNEPWAISGQNPAVHFPLWETIAMNAYDTLYPLNNDLLFMISGWGWATSPFWTDNDFLQSPNVVLVDHTYHDRGSVAIHARYDAYLAADVPILLMEIGYSPEEDADWADYYEAQLDLFDSMGLHYNIFCAGVGNWNLAYDIFENASPYALKANGTAYSNHIKAL
jgi:aryl-phospho-beta-D-glucosidase BglC (GH1 family)